jgi:hypothetical protein
MFGRSDCDVRCNTFDRLKVQGVRVPDQSEDPILIVVKPGAERAIPGLEVALTPDKGGCRKVGVAYNMHIFYRTVSEIHTMLKVQRDSGGASEIDWT